MNALEPVERFVVSQTSADLPFVTAYRDGDIAKRLVEQLHAEAGDLHATFMEVCGTHTMAISRHGIRQLVPKGIRLISGPGCPVCVTPNAYLDYAVTLARLPNVTVATFGDMLRVPGSRSSLEREKARGADVRLVYSPRDAVAVARAEPEREVVFLGVGFETTAPTVAAAILEAKRSGVKNFSVLCAHKTMPQAMRALVADGRIGLDGFICPGHVSAIIGAEPYRFLAEEFGKACVITGFEPVDILQGLLMLVRQVRNRDPEVEIQYRRVVRPEGNPRARQVLERVFEPCDAEWRGLGWIPGSGLKIRPEFADYDAEVRFPLDLPPAEEPPGCRCGEVLQGLIRPDECPLFGTRCTPENPVGACMVSSEGTCAAYYRYGVM